MNNRQAIGAIDNLIETLERLKSILDDSDRVMTCGEAAHLLGVAPSTISCYIRDGKLKKVTSGGVTGVWGKDVMKLM